MYLFHEWVTCLSNKCHIERENDRIDTKKKKIPS